MLIGFGSRNKQDPLEVINTCKKKKKKGDNTGTDGKQLECNA